MGIGLTNLKFIKRFTIADRRLHWFFTLGFIILLITGAIMYYVGSWSGSPQKVIHLLGGLIFIIPPILYLIKNKNKRNWLFIFKWNELDWKWFRGLLANKKVPQGKFNAIQKFSFLLVIIVGLISAISGIILIFGVNELSLLFHNISTIIFVIFFALHVIFYFYEPYRRALKSIIKGNIDVNYAKEHHLLWYENVKDTAFYPNENAIASKRIQKANK